MALLYVGDLVSEDGRYFFVGFGIEYHLVGYDDGPSRQSERVGADNLRSPEFKGRFILHLRHRHEFLEDLPHLDPQLVGIVVLSLEVSLAAVAMATLAVRNCLAVLEGKPALTPVS